MLNEVRLKLVMGAILGVEDAVIDERISMDDIETWDSMRHMQLVLALEDEFKVTIPDEDAANITSYALIKLVLTELLEQR